MKQRRRFGTIAAVRSMYIHTHVGMLAGSWEAVSSDFAGAHGILLRGYSWNAHDARGCSA